MPATQNTGSHNRPIKTPMAKKIVAVIKLALQAGKANPAPPVGPALGQHGVNIMAFCKEYNAKTEDKRGQVVPVEITIFEDRSFTFIQKHHLPHFYFVKQQALIKLARIPDEK